MAWQTPKTDWTPADGVADTDINRIEGNIEELKTTTDTHTQQLTYILENIQKVRLGGIG